jgi:hypothetical protein
MRKTNLPQIVPQEYGGKWIAWTKDARRIVAVGDTPEEAQAAAERAGVRDATYQWAPPPAERFIGSSP